MGGNPNVGGNSTTWGKPQCGRKETNYVGTVIVESTGRAEAEAKLVLYSMTAFQSHAVHIA